MKRPKNKAKNQDHTQPLLFDVDTANAHPGKLPKSENKALLATKKLCNEVTRNQSKPFNQPMSLLPWGEEALGL